MADGEFVTWLEPGNLLHPRAIERVLAAVSDDVDFVYTDENELDRDGRQTNAELKPDWSPDRLRTYPYTGRLAVFRRTCLEDAGGIRPDLGAACDHDVALRVGGRARHVVHVPEVLHHGRQQSPATTPDDATAEALRAVAEHLTRTRFPATVKRDPERPRLLRLLPELSEQPPVTIVIPTGGRRRMVHAEYVNLVANCVKSVVSHSTYPDFEILCVVDDGIDDVARDELVRAGGDRLRLVHYQGPFDFARKINVGVLHARSDYFLFLNDDTQVITPEWIESLLMFAQQPELGAVGAKLRFADGRLQHVGIVAVNGSCGHPYYGFPAGFDGHMYNARTPTNCLAVTAACMMTRRDCFEAVGGMSTTFPLNYNDVDYCLKLHHSGYRVAFNPYAELFHYESSSRAVSPVLDTEVDALLGRWGRLLRHDPYYNPGFGTDPDFAVPLTVPSLSS
jgi:glycosyltransferase involved in cell wall biosynthesis